MIFSSAYPDISSIYIQIYKLTGEILLTEYKTVQLSLQYCYSINMCIVCYTEIHVLIRDACSSQLSCLASNTGITLCFTGVIRVCIVWHGDVNACSCISLNLGYNNKKTKFKIRHPLRKVPLRRVCTCLTVIQPCIL